MTSQNWELIRSQHLRIEELKELWVQKIRHCGDLSVMKDWIYNCAIYLGFHAACETYYFKQLDEFNLIQEHHDFINELYNMLVDDWESVEELGINVDQFLMDYWVHHSRHEEKFFLNETVFSKLTANPNISINNLGSILSIALESGIHAILFGFMEVSFYEKYIEYTRLKTKHLRNGSHKWLKMIDMSHWNYYEPEFSPYIVKVNEEEVLQGMNKKYYYTVNDKIANHMIKAHGGNSDYIFQKIDDVISNEDLKLLLSSEVLGVSIVGNTDFVEKHIGKYIEST